MAAPEQVRADMRGLTFPLKGLTDQEFEDAFDAWLAVDPYGQDLHDEESSLR